MYNRGNRGSHQNQYKKIQPPRRGPERSRVKARSKSRKNREKADHDLERYKKEMNLQQKLYEFFQTQGELKNTTALGQAFLALGRANQLWNQKKYAQAALMYILVSSIVATYAPHMKDTMGMSHEEAPPMGDHKAMLEYHYPVGHPLHGKYKNDKDIQKVLKHFEKRAKVEAMVEAHRDERGKDKQCCPSCPVSCITFGGGRREMNWMDYSNKKTRKRRRKRGGAKTPKKGNKKSLSDEESLDSDEQFPSLEELSRTPPELEIPPQNTLPLGATISDDIGDYLSAPSPTLAEKMKDPDYAASYNRQQLKLKKNEFEKAGIGYDKYGKEVMLGHIYTPQGLGVRRELARNYDDDKNPFKNSKQFLDSIKRRRTVENPGLFENFSGWPKEDIDMPNLHIYPETRKGSLLDTSKTNEKDRDFPKYERIGNKGVFKEFPYTGKLGGRKTRKKRGRGKRKRATEIYRNNLNVTTLTGVPGEYYTIIVRDGDDADYVIEKFRHRFQISDDDAYMQQWLNKLRKQIIKVQKRHDFKKAEGYVEEANWKEWIGNSHAYTPKAALKDDKRGTPDPQLYDRFKGIPEGINPSLSRPHFPYNYPQQTMRKGSLLDASKTNEKDREGNKGVFESISNEKLGGRKTRKRRGKGRKRKTRRIVCRKRKLTRKKRRRRR